MKASKIYKLLILLISITLVGCGGTNVRTMQEMYISSTPIKSYKYPVKKVTNVVVDAMKGSELEIKENVEYGESGRRIIGHHFYDLTSGQHVRVILLPKKDNSKHTDLYYSSKKDYSINIIADLAGMRKKIIMYIDDTLILEEKKARLRRAR